MSRDEQLRFMFFSALLIITPFITLPVEAIRHQNHNSNSVLSLILHHPDSIINPNTHNHATRTKMRMEADAARVKYLNSRLRNALFKPNSSLEAENVQSQLTILRGGYVARIGVGQPATESTLIADTGSSTTWLKCSPCSNCSDPIFDPSTSSSYQMLSCNDRKCSTGTCAATSTDGARTCAFKETYGDHSTTQGDFITETLSFGSSDSVKNVAIGCGHRVGGNLHSSGLGGILGLGPEPNSLPSQLGATSFSYCLVGSKSASTPGTLDLNSAAPVDSITVTMVRNPVKDLYYYVELTGITVGEETIPVPREVYRIDSNGFGGVVVDSGTTLTFLDLQVYISFVEAFQKNAQDLVSSSTVEGCYYFPSESSLQGPAVSFQFSDGQSLALAPQNLFMQVADETTYCLAFRPTDQIVSIIGNIAQKGMRVTYDLSNKKIGFSPKKC